MKKVLLALLGLLLLAILAYFCFQNKADTIREHLVSSTNSALNSNDITGVTATLQGSDVEMTDIIRLTGEVPSLELKAKAEALTRAIDGVGGVDNQLNVAKQSLVSTSEGKEEEKEATETTTPKATSLATDDKASSKEDYTLNISRDEEGHVVLEGDVESKQQKEELLNYAQKLFGSKNVTDKLEVTTGAPKNWEHIASFALERLKEVDYGDMKLINQSYEFTGHLPSPSTKANFLDNIRKVMSNPENKYGLYRGDYIITAPVEEPKALVKKEEPAATKTAPVVTHNSIEVCQTKLDDLLAEEKILFDYNKASIKRDSYDILNRVVDSMRACHLSLLEIAGHTDNVGSTTYNQKLSEQRANSVKNYFVKQGFDPNKLQTIGYGESQPIASNRSSQGRAENRRIELIVKGVEK